MSVHSVPRDPTLNTLIHWHKKVQNTSTFLVGAVAATCAAITARMPEPISLLSTSLLAGACVGLGFLALKVDNAIKNTIGRKIKDQILHEIHIKNSLFSLFSYNLEKSSALELAVEQKKTEFVRMLIDLNIDVNKGIFPLAIAAWNGDVEIGRMLIEAGANLDEGSWGTGYRLFPPLHEAVDRNHPHFVQLLIDAGANIHRQISDGRTPLHFASSVETARLLIQAGANLDALDHDFRTPTFYVLLRVHPSVLQLLIRAGADLDAETIDGYTLLHVAAENKMCSFIKRLLRAGADPTIQNSEGKTPVQMTGDSFILQTFSDYANALHRELFTQRSDLKDPGKLIVEYYMDMKPKEEDPAESLKYLFT